MKVFKPYFTGALLFSIVFSLSLVIQGAVPFLLLPTLGQAVWTTGFSHSFSNGDIFTIFANNIGAPDPAPIVFGLAGAFPASIFIRLGLHASDAYAAMAALWLFVAFSSAYVIARHFQASHIGAVIAAFCWVNAPVIWGHAGYSMVSLGMALLSFYFLVAIKLMDSVRGRDGHAPWIYFYPVACLVSVFMDGYTFVMFAIGSSIMLAVEWILCREEGLRRRWFVQVFLVHVVSFLVAYSLYAAYIGKSSFEGSPLNFFRGWGADLSFFFIPTQGVHWVPDLMGWSDARTQDAYWGDASVWMTTFSLPMLIAAVWMAVRSGRSKSWIVAFASVAVFAFYMSLGPSLKVNSVKPADQVAERLMHEDDALVPTGSGWLSENLPGFNVMRASYRWVALGMFGAWIIVVLSFRERNQPMVFGTAGILVLVSIFNLPHLQQRWLSAHGYRAMFLEIDDEIFFPLREDLSEGEVVAFLPWRNDFLVNYLASKLEVVTYNIGGDKNFQMARESWPDSMKKFRMASPEQDFSKHVIQLFSSGSVDAVVLPYVDMLWAAHQWPFESKNLQRDLAPHVEQLSLIDFLTIEEREHYAIVRAHDGIESFTERDLEELLIYASAGSLIVDSFSDNALTHVGLVRNGVISAAGSAGFVHYGPYRPLRAGDYRLKVYGSIERGSGSWVDVTSSKGSKVHGRWILSEPSEKGLPLLDEIVILDENVSDLELRIYSVEGDKFYISGYEFVPK